MGERGPKNQIETTVVPLQSVNRPKPPALLSAEQVDIWNTVVDSLPADWFRPESIEVLVQYCRHAVAARRVAELIKQAETETGFDVQEYDRLLKMQEREGRALSSLATRLRITPQSTRSPDAIKCKAAKKKPWET